MINNILVETRRELEVEIGFGEYVIIPKETKGRIIDVIICQNEPVMFQVEFDDCYEWLYPDDIYTVR